MSCSWPSVSSSSRIALLWLICCSLIQQSAAQDFRSLLESVTSITDKPAKQAAVDEFFEQINAIPHIEAGTETYFLYRGNARSVALVGDLNQWDVSVPLPLISVPGTDLWYRSAILESNARLDYVYLIDGSTYVLDPLNPRTIRNRSGLNSVLAMPDYVPPSELTPDPAAALGRIEHLRMNSSVLGHEMEFKVYLPPFYDAGRLNGYPSAYMLDGFESIELGSATTVLDNLIDGSQIDPVIAIFVEPSDHSLELAGAERHIYRKFLTEELVPYIESGFNAAKMPGSRAVLGSTLAGNMALYIAYTRPDLFGNCGIFSAYVHTNDDEVFDLFTEGEQVNVRMAGIWGTYERPEVTDNMKRLKGHFAKQGYENVSFALPEGPSWGLWAATLDEMLRFFFPYRPRTDVSKDVVSGFTFSFDPVDQRIHYAFRLLKDESFRMKITDASGKVHHSKRYSGYGNIEGELGVGALKPGNYLFTMEFPGGEMSEQFVLKAP